jgi:ATP/maltotriose-dependent transcriptional regulator MalT/two-component SAPR family response regulator
MFELLDNKLAIVAAPAGYGKTSLLIDFADHIEYPVCWYSIDPMDRDLLRFLSYFISALHVKFPDFGHSSMAALVGANQGELNLDHLSTIIINDAYDHISEHFVIVLDDYHLVDGAKQIDQFVSRFIQDVDENCHLMIASRTLLTLPDFPLMVARAQVGGLSFEELAFQSDELQSLMLQNYQLSLSEQASQELITQAEGWITGLLLSTQSIQSKMPDRRRVAKVSGVGLNDYLEQVLSSQPEELQTFLMRTSFLEEFDGKLCAEVIGQALNLPDEDWDGLVEEVVRSNLFVLLVGEEHIWLRYHHLFRDFLQSRMSRLRQEETRLIQQSLAAYFSRHGDWEGAYRFYYQLGDEEQIANLIELASGSMVNSGRVKVLESWLDKLAPDTLAAHPMLLAAKANVAVAQSNPKLGLDLFNKAIETIGNNGNGEQKARILVKRAFTQVNLGEFASAQADADAALAFTQDKLELKPVVVDAMRVKAVSFYQQANLTEAREWIDRSLAISQSLEERPIEAVLLGDSGYIYQALGDYSAAERFYSQALDRFHSTGNSLWMTNSLLNLGYLQHKRGDYETAASTFERALQYARIYGVPRFEAYALVDIGDLYKDLQAVDEAVEVYRRAYELAEKVGDRFLLTYINLADNAIARSKGNLDLARRHLDLAWERAYNKGSGLEQNLCAMEAAILCLASGKHDDAAAQLVSVLELFSKEGHQIEAARCRLYLAIVYFEQQQMAKAAEYLAEVVRQAKAQETQQSLVVSGWWEKDRLEAMRSAPELSAHAMQFGRQVRQFEQSLPSLRKRLRQRTSAVPFAPPKIVIRALGKVQVKLNERTLTSADWQTQYARDLFFLLLSRPEGMTKEEIGILFWPDISSEELKMRFKNTVYRVRHAVGKTSILLQEEYYRFNQGLDYEYDVEEFLKAIKQAQRAPSLKEKAAHYQTAVRLYKGSYLPGLEETWNLSERERLYRLFLDSLLQLSELYLEGGQYQVALDYSHRALGEDPCLEAAHRLAMRIHAALGNRAAVARQYERCRQALLEEINATPSPQTQTLYDSLMHR